MTERNDQLKKLVDASGFPFQLAVENEIRAIAGRINWRIITREHPWKNPNDMAEGFIDLVVGYGVVRLVLECKRPRGGVWVFIISREGQRSTERFRICWTHTMPSQSDLIDWDDVDIIPRSPESEFCIVRGQGEGSETVLERLARKVLSSTEALAIEEMGLNRYSSQDKLRLLAPAIITSAELKICKCEPKDISLSQGTIGNSEFESVQWIRFRKSLSRSDDGDWSARTELKEISEKKERSIFVINSVHLSSFLEQWELEGPQFGPDPWILARQIEQKHAKKE